VAEDAKVFRVVVDLEAVMAMLVDDISEGQRIEV
jgi:hypothetical protein